MTRVHLLNELTLVAAKPLLSGDQAWAAWLTSVVADRGGCLWKVVDPGPAGRPGSGHSHVVHLPRGEVASYAREIEAGRVGGAATAHAEIDRADWTRAREPVIGEEVDAISGMIVAEVLCADPKHEAEWDAWYDQQHLPDMMASGAFVAGSRWHRATSRPGSTNHLTVYEIAGISVEEAIERSAAVMPGIVERGRKHSSHTGGRTWALACES
ncbi:MAG: hypothetical protein ACI9C1_002021 [Candidatus Aldehydirespiratoraceae bacterium]|jgi:hypothetical protein